MWGRIACWLGWHQDVKRTTTGRWCFACGKQLEIPYD